MVDTPAASAQAVAANTKAPSFMDKLKTVLESLEPEAKNVIETTIGMLLPKPIATAATMAVDTVDMLVRKNNPSIDNGAAAAAAAASPATDVAVVTLDALATRVAELETHVAALTAVTGNDTSVAMQTTKAAIATIAGTHGQ